MLHKTPCILIVDDDADTLANLSDILEESGFCVASAADGQRALEKVMNGCPVSGNEFDLCLVDFKMPGMNGAELLEHIRQAKPKMRAVMITAYAGNDGASKAKEAGATTVMKKPVDIAQLLKLIDLEVC